MGWGKGLHPFWSCALQTGLSEQLGGGLAVNWSELISEQCNTKVFAWPRWGGHESWAQPPNLVQTSLVKGHGNAHGDGRWRVSTGSDIASRQVCMRILNGSSSVKAAHMKSTLKKGIFTHIDCPVHLRIGTYILLCALCWLLSLTGVWSCSSSLFPYINIHMHMQTCTSSDLTQNGALTEEGNSTETCFESPLPPTLFHLK